MKRTVLMGLLSAALASALYGQTPVINAVVDAATFNTASPNLAPGSLAAIFGNNFGNSKSIIVTFGGKQAYLIAVANTQINLQIPVDAPLGATNVVVGTSAPFKVTLAQYAPVIATANGKGTGDPNYASPNKGPFKPGDTFALAMYGLGPTAPAVATGVAAPAPAPVTNAKVAAAIGGIPATVVFSGLAPTFIGLYQVNVTVPAFIPSGNLPLVLTVGGASSQADVTVTIVGNQPDITSVVNAASGNVQTLPNGGIAQGAIFTVVGTGMGPLNLAIDPVPFTNTRLLGTSASVTVKGTTVAALMYYTSANQIAGLLPSNTPVGEGTITATYNGITSAPAPITVVPSNAGIFTTPAGGAGAAVVTFPDYSVVSSLPVNCSGPLTACGAANPKDVLILWGTGLGAVSAPDSSGPQPGNMPNLPLKLFIGGVQASVAYQGRSGCCIGIDQIAFTVPENAPLGCAVPIFIQIENQISNYASLPVASGSRSCTPVNPTITPGVIAAVASGRPFNSAEIKLRRRPANNAAGTVDRADAQFSKTSVVPGMLPFLLSIADSLPLGSCTVLNSPTLDVTQGVFAVQGGLDAGPSLSLSGPGGNKVLPRTVTPGQPTDYFLNIGPNFFAPGTYTVTGTGGADVGPFTASLTIPNIPNWTNQASVSTITRSNGLTMTWSGAASQIVEISGGSFTDPNLATGAVFYCIASGDAGSFTVPPSVLLALPAVPASPNGFVQFQPGPAPVNFTATGLPIAFIDFNSNLSSPVTFK